MKIAFLLFIAFFICSSYGLKCYEYKLDNPRSTYSEPTVEDCNADSFDNGKFDHYYFGNGSYYCATVTYKNGDNPFVDCGGAEFCTERGCISDWKCIRLGTPHNNIHPGYFINNVNVTMTCCEKDLCNIESPLNPKRLH